VGARANARDLADSRKLDKQRVLPKKAVGALTNLTIFEAGMTYSLASSTNEWPLHNDIEHTTVAAPQVHRDIRHVNTVKLNVATKSGFGDEFVPVRAPPLKNSNDERAERPFWCRYFVAELSESQTDGLARFRTGLRKPESHRSPWRFPGVS